MGTGPDRRRAGTRPDIDGVRVRRGAEPGTSHDKPETGWATRLESWFARLVGAIPPGVSRPSVGYLLR